jgi:protein gp37
VSMGSKTGIEWTGSTWTPIRARNVQTGKVGWHCVHKSEACRNCYAETINLRLGTGLPYKPGHLANGDIELFLDETMLLAPLRWRKPRNVFVDSMTDLFGDFVPRPWIDRSYAVMALSLHTHQVLTKRPDRMAEYGNDPETPKRVWAAANEIQDSLQALARQGASWGGDTPWPLRNIWAMTSAGTQDEANENIPHVIATPAAKRGVSLEPLLGPIDLVLSYGGWPMDVLNGWTQNTVSDDYPIERLDWVIAGGESGRGARPSHPDWFRALRDQCVAAGVPFFFKQWGEWRPGAHDKVKIIDTSSSGVYWPDGSVGAGNEASKGGFGKNLYRVGKKAAGAMLDGREWRELPAHA